MSQWLGVATSPTRTSYQQSIQAVASTRRGGIGPYISDIRVVCGPCVHQGPLARFGTPFPHFDAVVGRGGEDASTVEVDLEDSDSVMVAGLKVAHCRHVGQYLW